MSAKRPEVAVWKVEDGIVVDARTGLTVAFVASPLGVSAAEAEFVVETNATLIAAAPSLLDASEAALSALDGIDTLRASEVTDALRDVIARAKGVARLARQPAKGDDRK